MHTTDLTDEQWAAVEPLLPAAKPGGRPRSADLREVLDALPCQNRTGCQWDILPHDLPPKSAVYERFTQWRDDSTFVAVVDAMRERIRLAAGREATPSAGSLEPPERQDGGGRRNGGRLRRRQENHGAEAARGGRYVGPAAGGRRDGRQRGRRGGGPRLEVVWADGKSHNHALNRWVETAAPRRRIEVVRRPEGAKGFVLLPKRWVVERTFGWLMRCRRLGRDHERRTDRRSAVCGWRHGRRNPGG